MVIFSRPVYCLDLLDCLVQIQSHLIHDTIDLKLRITANEDADAIWIISKHLLTAAANHHKAFALCRFAAQHGESFFRHVDFDRIGKRSDSAGGEKVDRLFVHLAHKFFAVAAGRDFLFDGSFIKSNKEFFLEQGHYITKNYIYSG